MRQFESAGGVLGATAEGDCRGNAELGCVIPK